MKIAAMKRSPALLGLIGLLILTGLACAQAGEVLTPEEATERARLPIPDEVDSDFEGQFTPGDQARLTGRTFLINILDQPAGRIITGQERGVVVTIEQATEREGEVWYRIQAPSGAGWVSVDNLEPLEEEEGAVEEAEGGAGEGGQALEAGTTVYLTGTGFLINFYDEPGGRIVAGQERGAAVVVEDTTQADGETWVLITAPTGQGWVPAENITTEEP